MAWGERASGVTVWEYVVWDYTDDLPRSGILDTIDEAEQQCWYQHKYGVYGGRHDFGIRRRPKYVDWEDF